LQNPRGLYDGGLSLPLGKFGGLIPVRVHAGKPLPVLVKHSDLPMLVLAPPIFPELRPFSYGFCFGHGLNISTTILARKYQFGQYFACNRIILHYRIGCNDESQGTTNSSRGQAIQTSGERFFPFHPLQSKTHKESNSSQSSWQNTPL
jgi:hypothetical protein